jgi:hypothetical protein
MSQGIPEHTRELQFLSRLARSTSRRQFLKWSGVTLAVAAAGCDRRSSTRPQAEVSLGSGDTAVLNYGYALEQLEAAFYTEAVANPYGGITAEETQILTDIRNHEVVHRDFFKAAIGAGAIRDLEVDFTSVDFTSRTSVLSTAKIFEDLGVSAYNGAGQLLTSAAFLTLAGKIVSVEARHAAAIRALLAPQTTSFAGDDVITPATGQEAQRPPSQVLALSDPYIVTTIDGGSLP